MLLLCLLVLASGMPYEQYLIDYDKKYSTPEEIQVHREAYFKKIAFIEETNSQNLGYSLGINNFTDWTDAELAAFSNVKFEVTGQQSQIKSQPRVGGPTSVDWRGRGKVTPIRNQGTCGACWAFSSLSLYQSLILINNNTALDLSQEFVLQCSNTSINNCQGGRVHHGMLRIAASGCPLESTYPYRGLASGSTTPVTAGICSSNSNVMMQNNIKVSIFQNVSVTDMKALLEFAPIAVLVDSRGAFIQYTSGVFSCGSTLQSNLDHAVVLVGYTATTFILRNSWGSGWGEQGYMQLDQNNDCGARYWVYVMSIGELRVAQNKYQQVIFGIWLVLGLLLVF